MSSGNKIDLLVKGQAPSLLDTNKGNEVINAINALQDIQISYGDSLPQPDETEAIDGSTGTIDTSEFEEVTFYVAINGLPRRKTFFVKDV
jgi:hypothetical protein